MSTKWYFINKNMKDCTLYHIWIEKINTACVFLALLWWGGRGCDWNWYLVICSRWRWMGISVLLNLVCPPPPPPPPPPHTHTHTHTHTLNQPTTHPPTTQQDSWCNVIAILEALPTSQISFINGDFNQFYIIFANVLWVAFGSKKYCIPWYHLVTKLPLTR